MRTPLATETSTATRRDVIGKMGAALFTFSATTLLRSRSASANHVGPPAGCYGYPSCHCCNSCGPVRADLGCPTGTGCWYGVDTISCRTYKCCDYMYNGAPCLCRTLVCYCC